MSFYLIKYNKILPELVDAIPEFLVLLKVPLDVDLSIETCQP